MSRKLPIPDRHWPLPAVVFFLSAGFIACQDGRQEPRAAFNSIDFELVTLDHDDVETPVFESATDVKVALRLINNSVQELAWNYSYTCQIFQSKDFLLFHKLDQVNWTDNNYLSIGTPYQGPINCLAINYPPHGIPPGESLIIKLSWSDNPENEPLPAGNYYATANFELTIQGETNVWNLRTDFEIL